jgi:ABC-type transport system substrate-binding protein
MVPLASCVQPEGAHPNLDWPVGTTVESIGDYYSWNFTNFCDPELDRRLQRAVQLTDPYASAQAFQALDQDFVDLAAMIPVLSGTDVWLVSKRVSNVEFSAVYLQPIVSQVSVQ